MKRFIVLSVVFAALLTTLSCDPLGTSVTLLNNGRDPIHPGGGQKLAVGASRQYTWLKHSGAVSIDLQRDGSSWATLGLSSLYLTSDIDQHLVTITITEPTYGTFAASSDNENIEVTVNN